MKNLNRHFFVILLLMAVSTAKTQSVKDVFANSGIWEDYGTPVSAKTYPEFKGRLVNINWADIETSPGVWSWSLFDNDIQSHIADSMPVIFMVYTCMNAPQWLYTNGVPKVNVNNSSGVSIGYSPYYLDPDYNFYFKRMITTVRQHVQSMQSSMRNKIIGVQACFGSTGDPIAYKGSVPANYQITTDQFDSLFKVYSAYYYNEYKNLNPQVTMLSNPDPENSADQYWLIANCPGGWMKCGTMAKGSQLNLELDKNKWLYDILNKPWGGQYIKARSEIVGSQLSANWWTKNPYKEMFATMCSCIYWGIDWPNETSSIIQDPKNDSAFNFFNKYAGQKVPGLAQNAVCALKDALDASDSIRFPSAQYGTVYQTNQQRYMNILKDYSKYGAMLEDVVSATGNEYSCLAATGTNDVGWHILPGNYERYIHQIDANITSAGYWNLDNDNTDVMYGRFARGFDVKRGRNGLYFDVEDDFFRNVPLNSAYSVTIEITYYDKGKGSWQLYYDAQTNSDKACAIINITNTKTWKKAKFILTDARFANSGERASDFYIKNAGTVNVAFSVVELSRPAQSATAFVTTPLTSFDTVCVNSDIIPKAFVVNATTTNDSKVQVGPLTGYLFSTASDGTYSPSLSFTGYNKNINSTIYVKIDSKNEGAYNDNIPVSGGGLPTTYVNADGTVLNTSPLLNANVTTISCINMKNGVIELQPQGGLGPFSYLWKTEGKLYWSNTAQNLDSLNVGNYTVTVSSAAGCSVSRTFSISQPDALVTSVTQDSSVICKGGTTSVNVSAAGGTTPYSGTGTFNVYAGFQTYTVTDQRGCTDPQGYKVENGTISSPNKPAGINGPTSVTQQQSNIIYSVTDANSSNTYLWTVPPDAIIVTGQYTSAVTVAWGVQSGNIMVEAHNVCGISPVLSKKVTVPIIQNALAIRLPGSDNGNMQMLLAPNPVTTTAILSFNAQTGFAYTIRISDVSGKLLLEKRGITSPGTTIEKMDVHSLTAGSYFIMLIKDNGEKQTFKMIKK